MRCGHTRRLRAGSTRPLPIRSRLGLSTIVCSPRPRLRTSDDWKSFADELNKYGERTKAAGLTLGFHDRESSSSRRRRATCRGTFSCSRRIRHSSVFRSTSATSRSAAAIRMSIWRNIRALLRRAVKDFKRGKAAIPVGAGDLDWKRISPSSKRLTSATSSRKSALRREHTAGPAARAARLQRARAVQAQRGVSGAFSDV